MERLKEKTLDALLVEFLDNQRSLNYSPHHLRVMGYNVRRFLAWLIEVFGVRTCDRLRTEHLHRWQQHFGQRIGRRGLPLKPRTVNKNLESVRCFLTWLAERDHISARMVEALHYVKVPNLLPSSVLTHGQVKRLFKRIDTTTPAGYRNRTLLELLYSTGIRAGEVLRLNVEDINLEHRTAMVNGKGNKQRVVPLGNTAVRYVETYLKAVRPFLIRSDRRQSAVFLTEQGKRYPYHALCRMIAKASQSLDVEFSVTPHTFRRSCTTEMVRGGANLYHVKELLGHETLDTLKHYTRLTITDIKRTHAKCHPREREER